MNKLFVVRPGFFLHGLAMAVLGAAGDAAKAATDGPVEPETVVALTEDQAEAYAHQIEELPAKSKLKPGDKFEREPLSTTKADTKAAADAAAAAAAEVAEAEAAAAAADEAEAAADAAAAAAAAPAE